MEATVAKKKESFEDFSDSYEKTVNAHLAAMAAGRELNIKPAKIKEWEAREGLGLRCDLTLDGKKVGEAYDDGNGGSTTYEFSDPKVEARFNKDFPGEEFSAVLEKLVVEQQMAKQDAKISNANAKKGFGFTVVYKSKRGFMFAGLRTQEAVDKFVEDEGIKEFRIVKPTVPVADPNTTWKLKVLKMAVAAGHKTVVFYHNDKGGMSAYYPGVLKDETSVRLEVAKRKGTNPEIVSL